MKVALALVIALSAVACGGPEPVAAPPVPTLTPEARRHICTTRGEQRCSEDLTVLYLCADTSGTSDTWVADRGCKEHGEECGWANVNAGTLGCLSLAQ